MPNGEMLNVILHGAFAYIDSDKDFIDALIPLRTDDIDHVFRAGNWLGETELRPGTYKLEGVEKGGDRLNVGSNLIFENECPRRPRDPGSAYARLVLPRPQKISSLRLAKVDFARRPPNLKGNHDQAAAVQVFTYLIENEPELRLQRIPEKEGEKVSGHYWEPVFTGDYANLHIFSAEDHPDDPKHTSHAFDATSKLLQLEEVKLKTVHLAREIQEKDLPPGVIAEETEELARRTLRMARLGRLRRQNVDLNQAWYENEALDGDPEACMCKACQ